MRTCILVLLSQCAPADGAKQFRHKWDTVGDVMGMHGKFHSMAVPAEESLQFMANNYAMVTTGGDCSKMPSNATLEETTLGMVTRMKAYNPDVLAGMYWRTDMIVEVGQCTKGDTEWNSHADWALKDDQGNKALKNGHIMFDYANKAVYDFFMNLLLDVLKEKLPSGAPVVNYIYLDGTGGSTTSLAPGIGPERSQQLMDSKHAFYGDLQLHADTLGHGQLIFLNGADEMETAQTFSGTGAGGTMIDHWSILQFLQRGKDAGDDDGKFNVTMMDELFDLVRSDALSNMTLQIKGWVGPIIRQKDQYPKTVTQPVSPADFQRVAGERFNSELALFLLVAEDAMYWQYSWFWTINDWVPGQPDSTVPSNFFPEAKCALGAPKGPPVRVPNTWSYTREFEQASVFVDLEERTASRVTFKSCPPSIVV